MSAPPQSPEPTAHRPPKRSTGRRVLRGMGWGLIGLLLLCLALLAGLWWWSGQEQSLARTLVQVARWLPAGQTLETQDVQGSLRRGGHIGQLRWRSDTMQVSVEQATIGWQLRPLLSRRVQLGEVRAARVRIETFAQPDKVPEPLQPLQSLALPVEIDLPFHIEQVEWVGPPTITAQTLRGHYRYQDQHHHLRLDGVGLAEGHYSGSLQLQGPAPMALELTLQGRVQAALAQASSPSAEEATSGTTAPPLQLNAQARAHGTLAGADAQVQVNAQLQPLDTPTTPPPERPAASPPATVAAPPVHATLNARLAPWSPQPVLEAQAELSQLNLAWLLPQAPRTLLSGQVHVAPAASTLPPSGGPAPSLQWLASASLRNALPLPWDEGGLPLEALRAQLRYDTDAQTLHISEARIEAGRGHIDAEGEWRPGPTPWQLSATVHNVRPGLLHTQLAGAALQGRVQAQQRSEENSATLDFDVALKAAGGALPAPLQGLNLQVAEAKGRWQTPAQHLDLQQLRLLAARVDVQGQAQLQLPEQAGQARLRANLPGAQLTLDTRMAPTQGQGQVELNLRDASTLQRWIESLPGLEQALGGQRLQGEAELNARWQGGWQSMWLQWQQPEQRLPQGHAVPTLNAQLSVPNLRVQPPPHADASTPPALQLRQLRATLEGRLTQAQLSLQGEAAQGPHSYQLKTQASGGLQGAGDWRLQLSELQAQAQDRRRKLDPWRLALASPFNARLRLADKQMDVEGSASGLRLQGPMAGTVRLDWEPLRLQQRNHALRLQSKGSLQGLPLAWVRALGGDASLREMGLSGDLIFEGDWDIDAGEQLRARARLARASGDLRVQAGETALVRRIESQGTGTRQEITVTPTDQGPGTPAGLRQAELIVQAEGSSLRAALRWDSERAGKIDAEASTQLQAQAGGWQWNEDAPISGRLRAALPQLGVWSMLAPPGWRMDGSMQADVALSGSRNDPRWHGTLAADKLALLARVEGLDLRDGRLRATLDGDRLRLEDFTLYGGPANPVRIAGRGGNLSTVSSERARDGGSLSVRGEAQWSRNNPRVDLRATVDHLRALARTDRQVTVSGELHTLLNNGQLQIRGKVTADRGAITLPDASAPSLGSDVVVHSSAKAREASEAAEREAAARRAAEADTEDDIRPQQPLLRHPPDIAVVLDLGRDFAVQGMGITTRLEGALNIRATSLSEMPRVTGEVRTVQGQYRAYGQALDVEDGLARFNGPVTNPQLDILALRPNIAQRAGVRITGSAQAPRVTLYSDPVLSEAETLSWVLLGRASATSGGEALLMQQAALALLGGLGKDASGGSLASRFGLDELGFKGPGTGGELSDSTVTLGKRLSKDFYITYERGLASALGTLFIFYDLTQNLTLRGQAGQESAVDLIYTVKYD